MLELDPGRPVRSRYVPAKKRSWQRARQHLVRHRVLAPTPSLREIVPSPRRLKPLLDKGHPAERYQLHDAEHPLWPRPHAPSFGGPEEHAQSCPSAVELVKRLTHILAVLTAVYGLQGAYLVSPGRAGRSSSPPSLHMLAQCRIDIWSHCAGDVASSRRMSVCTQLCLPLRRLLPCRQVPTSAAMPQQWSGNVGFRLPSDSARRSAFLIRPRDRRNRSSHSSWQQSVRLDRVSKYAVGINSPASPASLQNAPHLRK